MSKFKSKHYQDELIFHPSNHTSQPNLLIEVLDNKKLKGVIPCANKDFICLNIPVIGARFTPDTNYRVAEKNGIPIYELQVDSKTYSFEPQTVCDFIKCLTSGILDVSSSNAIEFCYLADYWNCEQILNVSKSYVNFNMENTMLVDAWNFGDNFMIQCNVYMRKYPGFIDEVILQTIGRLEFDKFNTFINLCKFEVRWFLD